MSQHQSRARNWAFAAQVALGVSDYVLAASCARKAVQEARKAITHYATSKIELRIAAAASRSAAKGGRFTLGQVVELATYCRQQESSPL